MGISYDKEKKEIFWNRNKIPMEPVSKQDKVIYTNAQLTLEIQAERDRFWREAEFLNNRIGELESVLEDVKRELKTLGESKLDRPSVSEELVRAEQYIDDYMECRKRFVNKNFAAKQRVKKKLEKLKKNTELSEEIEKTKRNDRMYLAGKITTLIVILILFLL